MAMANFRSTPLIHLGLLTTDYPYQQARHDLFPSAERVERSFFLLFIFFLKCVDILLLNSHISQQHLPAQVHLPPFLNFPHKFICRHFEISRTSSFAAILKFSAQVHLPPF
jgi:hypothetical protein